MLDHVMDLSQLIVERNTLFSCIVPTEKQDDNRLQTLNCLYVMFNNYLIKLKDFKETEDLNKYADLVMVSNSNISRLRLKKLIKSFLLIRFNFKMVLNNQFI